MSPLRSEYGDVTGDCVGIGTGGTGGTWPPELSMMPGMKAIGMTLDARVRTVEAIDSRVRMDARASEVG